MRFTYDPDVYNVTSAEEIVPLIIDWINPSRVVDVGCGIGTWLSVFKRFGVPNLLGIDGSHVDKALLHINNEEFLEHDLREPIDLGEKFDLVISLEVAEHIPESFSDTFIDTLTNLGSCILFSAAIPYQGGDGHLNEQWPSYWQEKFDKRGFILHDCIRSFIWNNKRVKPWYRQNMFLAVHKKYEFSKPCPPPIIDIVHTEYYVAKASQLELSSTNLERINSGNITLRHILSILRNYLLRKVNLSNRIK